MVYEGGEGLKVWNDELPLESLSQEDYVTANTSRNRNTYAHVKQLQLNSPPVICNVLREFYMTENDIWAMFINTDWAGSKATVTHRSNKHVIAA